MPKQTLREFGEAHAPAAPKLFWPFSLLLGSHRQRRQKALAFSLARHRMRMEALSLIEPLGMLLEDENPDRALRSLSDLPLDLEISEQARILCRFALGAPDLPSPESADAEEWLSLEEQDAWGRICYDLREGFPLSAPEGAWRDIADTLNSLRALDLVDWPSKIWGAAIERETIELALEWPSASADGGKRKSRGL